MKKSISKKIYEFILKTPIIAIIFCWCSPLLMSFLCFMPMIFDYHESSFVGRGFMIAGSVIFYVIFTVWIIFNEAIDKYIHTEKRAIRVLKYFYYITFLGMSIFWQLTYINQNIWGARDIGLIIANMVNLALQIYNLLIYFSKFFNNEKIPMLMVAFATLILFLSFNLFYTQREISLILIKIAVGIFYIELIAIYIHNVLLNSLDSTDNKHKILLSIIHIALPIAVILSFPYYIQWCGLTDKNFDTFVTVYSALIGGSLTLAGVAWTINKSAKERQSDERKKFKPIFNYIDHLNSGRVIDLRELKEIDNFSFGNKIGELYLLKTFCITNTDFTDFYFKGIMINDDEILLKGEYYIRKSNDYFITFHNKRFYYNKKVKRICLLLEDLLGNKYSVKLVWEINELANSIQVVDIDRAVLENSSIV